MKHQKKRISNIVHELTMYLFSISATDIHINIQETEDEYKIHIKSNYCGEQDEKLDRLIKLLKCPKQEEVEEYYWELTGESEMGTELSLVGMMIDDAEIDINEGYLEIILHRNK
ncbi:MAG: hypothetical protein AB7G87_14250 [Clostridia bacterium]